MAENGEAYTPCFLRQLRRRRFTIFSDPDRFYDEAVATCEAQKDVVRFLTFQKELCPTTGRPHIQGYIETHRAMRGVEMQSLFPTFGAFNMLKADASSEANIKYCSKLDTRVRDPVQWGEPSRPGTRTDLAKIAHSIVEEGKSLRSIAMEEPATFVRYYRGLQVLDQWVHQPRERPEPVIRFLHGPPDCGKSRLVRHILKQLHGSDYYGAHDLEQIWFDGYTGQKVVLFDEFTGKFPLHFMLQLLDRAPLRLPVKGGFVKLEACVFYFTSNRPPHYCYSGLDEQSAWLSRLNLLPKHRYSDVEVWDETRIRSLCSSEFDEAEAASGRRSRAGGAGELQHP